jgi:hypothetical protein
VVSIAVFILVTLVTAAVVSGTSLGPFSTGQGTIVGAQPEGPPRADGPGGSPAPGTSGSPAERVDPAAAAQARDDAGCDLLREREPLPDRGHFPPADAPDPADIYTDGRPTHSGPHTDAIHPFLPGAADRHLDERTLTHNLEHGAVVVWFDPAQVDLATAQRIAERAAALNASGFRFDGSGAAIFVSPFDDPGISSGKALAFRAWGTAMDCDRWDQTVADAFVIDHFGSRGAAPERLLAPYPDGVLDYAGDR